MWGYQVSRPYFSVWCSWVTWYWVGVSLSLSSLLSNSFLGEMDFLMSGMFAVWKWLLTGHNIRPSTHHITSAWDLPATQHTTGTRLNTPLSTCNLEAKSDLVKRHRSAFPCQAGDKECVGCCGVAALPITTYPALSCLEGKVASRSVYTSTATVHTNVVLHPSPHYREMETICIWYWCGSTYSNILEGWPSESERCKCKAQELAEHQLSRLTSRHHTDKLPIKKYPAFVNDFKSVLTPTNSIIMIVPEPPADM